MNPYFHTLTHYADFNGRSSRKEFWNFSVINVVSLLVAGVLDLAMGTAFNVEIRHTPIGLPFGYIFMAFVLIIFIPSLSLTVRRLHDIDKSGWNLLIALIPLLGVLWFFDMMLTHSISERNRYGATSGNISLMDAEKTYQYN